MPRRWCALACAWMLSTISVNTSRAADVMGIPSLVPAYSSMDFEETDNESAEVDLTAFDDSELAMESPGVVPEVNYSDCGTWHWTDSLELFAGLEGSKQPQDFGVNAQFGARFHANWAMPLSEDRGIGLQIGTSWVPSQHAVAVTRAIEGSTSRNQSFTTVGLFQRTDSGWTWGIAHDLLIQDDYDTVTLGQWRGRVGYDVGNDHEIGFMGMVPGFGDNATWAGVPVQLDPLAQGDIYWRHNWEFGSQTTLWVGVAQSHGQANAVLGDRPDTGAVVVFGSDVHVPLNNHWALFGEANFVSPADTGTVDAYLGLAYYPGGGAVQWRRHAFSPVLPVASNSTFTTDLRR